MSTIFTKIIEKKIPAHIVAENKTCMAFLDAYPRCLGHTLVITKPPFKDILELPAPLLQELTLFAQHVGKAIKKSLPCKKVGMAVVGLEVPHVHIHLFPIKKEGDFFDKRTAVISSNQLKQVAQQIRKNYQG